ncbi:MAG: NAD-dependent epimerase/dehydratase family protein [Lachnospiraceae bacterium]|nr:NAD-dependent epimerase/dehydratase family protein [Lachnospiraceae bacterium]
MQNNPLYLEDIALVAAMDLGYEKLSGKSILVTGASGLIGSFLTDVIMELNLTRNLKCHYYALGRNTEKAKARFSKYWDNEYFHFISHDMNEPLTEADSSLPETVHYVLHMASNTHPLAYATDPIGTITTNIIGTQYLLEFAVKHHAERFAFTSSNEVYGENRGDVEFFDEHYCGYIDCNTMRAGYPESKRCGEALCQAYMKQKGLSVVIPRLTRSYGPSMLQSDTKAISQFIRKGVAGEDIVLKSAGTQYYSFTYMADAVSGLLTVLLKGEDGEAYNISDIGSDIMLKDLAALIAEKSGTKVIFEIPDELESSGYSKATKARLDGSKLSSLGWSAAYDITAGIERTLAILKEEVRGNE